MRWNMKTVKKKGISLIVLVITVIVIIILAVAVILSIANNNPIENAQKAAFLSDMSVLKDELNLYIQKKLADSLGTYRVSSLNATENSLYENGEKQERKTIKDVLPSLKDKYIDKIEINSGKLEYGSTDDMKELAWAKEAFEGVVANFDKVSSDNTNSVQVNNANKIESLRIYGNSIQNKRSGKNLFDISKVTTFVANDYTTKRPTYSSISDGVITSQIGVYKSLALLYDSKITLPAGTYTVSADFMAAKSAGNKNVTIGGYDIENKVGKYSYCELSNYRTWERKSYTFILDSQTDIVILVQGTGENEDSTNLNIKIKNIQLEIGDKATDYEEYGVSPSSDYPSEIQSVGDLVTDTNDINYGKYKIPISVTSKNLFDMKECITGTNIIDNGDGSITVKGYPAATSKKLSQIAPDLKVGNEFTFSIETNGYSAIYLNDINTGYQKYLDNKKTYTVTQDMLNCTVNLYRQTIAQGGNDAIIKYIQMELGSKVTDYEPYSKLSTTNIYLNEPLRKLGKYVDYIDFKNKKVVRNVKVNDNTGTKNLEESYAGLDSPIEETISLSDVTLGSGLNNIIMKTNVNPTKIEVVYEK